MSDQTQVRALIIGASSSIALSLAQAISDQSGRNRVVAVSRGPVPTSLADREQITWMQCDYSEAAIVDVTDQLRRQDADFNRLFICNGVLHNDKVFPEKRLKELDTDRLQQVMQINAFLPALWLKHLKPLFRGKKKSVITAFSARVGSISDNRQGGWYAYRASKAALNMLLRAIAIEYRRTAPDCTFIAFHPGTTDTPLSKPFQKSVPSEKLFTSEFVAGRLLRLTAEINKEPALQFLDWDARPIEW